MTLMAQETALEIFPVAIGSYRHYDDLKVGPEVEKVADALDEFGGQLVSWGEWTEERDEPAITKRMDEWAQAATGNTFLYWVGHGWASGERAVLIRSDSPGQPADQEGIVPAQLADWIDQRERHNLDSDIWSIVVVDTCRSAQFVERLNAELDKRQGSRRLLLIGVSGAGSTYLGDFSNALRGALRDTFAAEPYVDLWELGKELMARLPSHTPPTPRYVHKLLMRRQVPVPTQATLDMARVIQAALQKLSDAERYHYVPKAQGGELRELAWYFEGRSRERQSIVDWLAAAADGMLVVTGRAGSGKSALLGNLLVHSRPELRQAMIDAGLLEPLTLAEQPPDDVFSVAVYLTGLSAAGLITRIADELALPAPDPGARLAEQADALIAGITERAAPVTLLIDALDEADDPVGIARAVLRPLAALPGVRLLVGTRASASEGLGADEPPDRELLDALDAGPEQIVTVSRDPDAVRRYIRKRLTAAAAEDGPLRAKPPTIEAIAGELGDSAADFLFARLAVHEILADPGIVAPHRVSDLRELTLTGHQGLFARAVGRLRRRSRANYWLLTALAYAQGRGLPLLDEVWATAANALSDETEEVSNNDISALLEDASPYLAIDRDHDQTVYRLAHQAFTGHFTDQEEDQRRHRAIARRLIAASGEQPNGYIVHHLPAHVGAGGQAAWQHLAAHQELLDRLEPAAVTGAVMRTAFGRFPLPLAIAGIVAAPHLLATAPLEDRALLRQLSTARHTRSTVTPPAAAAAAGLWRLEWARFASRPLQVVLTGRPSIRNPARDHPESIRAITAVDLSQRPGLLVTGQSSGTARIWDPLTGGPVGEDLNCDGAVFGIVPLKLDRGEGERVVLVVGAGNGIYLWDPVLRIGATRIRPRDGVRFRALTLVPWQGGRTMLATGSTSGTIDVWNPVTGNRVGGPTAAHREAVNAITALEPPWPGTLATYGEDGVIRVWERAMGTWRQSREMTTRRLSPGYALAAVRLDAKRSLLVSGGRDGMIRLWAPTGDAPVAELRSHHNAVRAITVVRMPGGDFAVATGGDDRTIQLWDPSRRRALGAPFSGHAAQVLGITQPNARGGPALLASSSRDSSIRLWELTRVTAAQSADLDPGPVTALAELRLGRTDSMIAAGYYDGSVRLFETATGKPLRLPMEGNKTTVNTMRALALSADLNLLAVAGGDRVVKVWNITGGGIRLFREIITGFGSVTAIELVVDGDGFIHLLAGGRNGGIEFWNLTRARRTSDQRAAHGEHNVVSLRALPGYGTPLAASLGGDQTIRFWNPVDGTRGNLPPITTGLSTSAMESVPGQPGEPLIAAAFRDDRVRIKVWNAVSGAVDGPSMTWVTARKALGTPQGGGGKVTALAVMRTDAGKNLLVAGNSNHAIGLWDLATSSLLHRLDFGEEIKACLAVGERLLVGSASGIAVLRLNRAPE
jgi:WD40 repeat protein